MAIVLPYPHYMINVIDESIYNASQLQALPIHRPIYFMKTQKGLPGVPVWCNTYQEAVKIFGAETFNMQNPIYFSQASYFLLQTFPSNGAFICRVADTTAAASFIIVEATVVEKDIVQYEKDAAGNLDSPLTAKQTASAEFLSGTGWTAGSGWAGSFAAGYAHTAGEGATATLVQSTAAVSGTIYLLTYTITGRTAGTVSIAFGGVTTSTISATGTATITATGTGGLTITPTATFDGTIVMSIVSLTTTTKSGLEITWSTRSTLLNGEDDVTLLTKRTNADDSVTYPMMVFVASSAGAWGNDTAFKFYYDPKANDPSVVNRVGACAYSLAPLKKLYGESTVDPVYDLFASTANDFVMKPHAVDPATNQAVSMDKIIENAWTSNYPLPYRIIAYNSNFLEIGNIAMQYLMVDNVDTTGVYDPEYFYGISKTGVADIAARDALPATTTGLVWVVDASADTDTPAISAGVGQMYERATANGAWTRYNPLDTSLTYGWMVNIVSGKDVYNRPYDEIVINTTTDLTHDDTVIVSPSYMNSAAIHYLAGGADGATDDYNVEVQVRSALAGVLNPEIITNSPRYPFTHLFDVGYSLETKYAMLDLLATREDVKVYISTQQVTTTDNTKNDSSATVIANEKATDISVGRTLRSYALLSRESITKGTECCRASVFLQCGWTNDNYSGILPNTLWTALKHAQYQNKDYMDQEPKELPNSDISLFREYNWVPSSADMQNLAWVSGLNYCQYYSMTQLHYACIRSVYRYETSVLVDDTFTDGIVYSKHEIRQSWAKFAGASRDAKILQEEIQKDLEARLTYLYHGKFKLRAVKVYQTDEEAKIGYIQHVLIQVEAPNVSRVWDVDIACYRQGYTPAV